MPIRPEPRTYTCTACGWSATTAPRSDALMPGDNFSQCPRCGNTALNVQKANLLDVIGGHVKKLLGN
jgi:ribosomal protein L37E